MQVVDIWPGKDVADQIGHVAGAWNCPCGPWVLTDMDEGDEGMRTVRHGSTHDYRHRKDAMNWIRRTENPAGHDYVSDDGRWRILSPKLSCTNRYELYDLAAGQWYGDWFTLAAAKKCVAQQLREEQPVT